MRDHKRKGNKVIIGRLFDVVVLLHHCLYVTTLMNNVDRSQIKKEKNHIDDISSEMSKAYPAVYLP